MNRISIYFVLAALAVCAGHASAAGPLAIQGAKIITVTGETIENGTILIRDGKIEAVGVDIDVPGEARVIDGTGKVVMPGYIDAHNSSGMSQANEQNEFVPFLSVVDSIDPVASYFEECRRNGITTAAVVPGNSTLIGGKAAIVKTAGQYVDDMLLRRDSALKLSLRPTGGSRMSHLARLRKEFDRAKREIEREAEAADEDDSEGDSKETDSDAEAGTGDKAPAQEEGDDEPTEDGEEEKEDADDKKDTDEEDEGWLAMKAALQGELPVYIYCPEAMDVAAADRLIKDYAFDAILVLGQDCHKASKLLKKQPRAVILDPTLVFWESDARTREDRKIVLPEIYREAGVPFIFQTDDPGSRRTIGTSYFWYQAATAVKYGTPEKDALAALTIEPAKLLGVDDLVGSIEVGKDADLVVLTGDPLDIATWVETTIVGGEVVYERADDEKLERLLSPVAE